MNTMAHGIARLSPNYCCDRMRFRLVGTAASASDTWQGGQLEGEPVGVNLTQ